MGYLEIEVRVSRADSWARLTGGMDSREFLES